MRLEVTVALKGWMIMIKKVTIQEISETMGLSRNTVAKALTNSDIVAYETREAVVRKAWEMGYSKFDVSLLEAFNIVSDNEKSKTVLVLARREMSLFWNSIIVGISEELKNFDSKMRIDFVSAEDEENGVIPSDIRDGIDGIIMMSVFTPKFTEQILKLKIPVVSLDRPYGRFKQPQNFDAVMCEGRESVAAITSSLIDLGMKKIGFIGNITYCESLYQRYQGFRESMNEHNLAIDDRIVFTSHQPEMYSIAEVEKIVNDFPYLPDGIVCCNDDVALKVIKAYMKKGIRSPRDFAITGFDNEEVLTNSDPKLTTVSVKNHMLGKRLVQQLMWRIQNPDLPYETVMISTKPLYRGSSNHRVR